nr:hypothetical protein [Tanacetum cinerariifolium]
EEQVESVWVKEIEKGEIIANIDADKDVTLKDVAAVEKTAKIEKDVDVQGRPEESQAQIYKIDQEHADKVGDLSSHTTKYSSPALTQKVFTNTRKVGKGFSGVETPLFESMIVAQQADDVADKVVAGVDIDDVLTADVEPTLPTPTIQPPPPSQELPSTSQVMPTSSPSPIAEPSSPPQQQQ